jgi:hypothetical protein
MFRKVLFLVLLMTCLLNAPASAQSLTTPKINHAYAKGSTYDVVVKFNPKAKLTIFLNDRRKGHAKFNKQGWATYKKVPLQSQGSIHFEKFTWKGYKPVGGTIYYQKNGNNVSFYTPKYSYDDFTQWLTTNVAKQHYWKWDGIGDRDLNTYAAINTKCHTTGDWSNSEWKACMQNAYSRFLKPETFATDQNINDFLDMVGTVQNKFGDYQNFASQEQINTAHTIYVRLAVSD